MKYDSTKVIYNSVVTKKKRGGVRKLNGPIRKIPKLSTDSKHAKAFLYPGLGCL